jgi:hypothetical protein
VAKVVEPAVGKAILLQGALEGPGDGRRIEWRAPVCWRGRCIFESRPAYSLSSTPSGTSIIHVAEGGFAGPLGFLDLLFWPVARRERVRTVDALEASFRGDDPTAASD